MEILFRYLGPPKAPAPELCCPGSLLVLVTRHVGYAQAVSGPTSDSLVFNCGFFFLRPTVQVKDKKMCSCYLGLPFLHLKDAIY